MNSGMSRSHCTWMTGFIVLLAMICGGSRAQAPVPVESTTRAATDALDLTSNPDARADRLYAQIWVEISPEYRALCRQVFNSALLRLRAIAELSPEVGGRPVGAGGKPLAVVTDLDETILDNSGYQRQLVLAGKEFSVDSWNQWVRQEGAELAPGAGEFIQAVESLGVTVVYISNRPEDYRQSTVNLMRRLGINVDGLAAPDNPRLQLRRTTSDKEPRRRRAREHYDIVAYLGDNIGDFPGVSGDDVLLEEVDRRTQMWGTRWFVMPNPLYGSWTRPLRTENPREMLERLP